MPKFPPDGHPFPPETQAPGSLLGCVLIWGLVGAIGWTLLGVVVTLVLAMFAAARGII